MPASPFPFAYLLPFVGTPFSLGQGGGALGWPRDGPCLFTLLQVCTQSTELPSLLCPCPSALCSMGQQPLGCMRARAVRCTGGGGGLPPHMSQAGGPTLQTGLNLDPSRKDAKGAGDTRRARSGCVRMRQRNPTQERSCWHLPFNLLRCQPRAAPPGCWDLRVPTPSKPGRGPCGCHLGATLRVTSGLKAGGGQGSDHPSRAS